MPQSGIHAFLELLAAGGVRYLFGNPGTTELPLSDALVGDRRIEYILGLQEIPVMGMADGYAMASGRLGVANLHVSCGLGNAMGMLYNAFREGTPLLVTAGQQDRRLLFSEPILGGELTAVVRPWTKWAAEVNRLEDLPSAVRRAIQIALTPPTGPVFLSLPLDLQMEEGELDLSPARPLDFRTRPSVAALEQAALLLAEAKNPAVLAGSRVAERGAADELVRLVERLGAPVYGEPGHTHGRLAFPADHPLYGQILPHWAPRIRAQLEPFDVLLVVGMDLLREYIYHGPEAAIPAGMKIIHVDEDPYQIGKNYRVAVGVLGETKTALAELDRLVGRRMSGEAREEAARRSRAWGERHATARASLEQKIAAQANVRPLAPAVFMGALAGILPANVAVIEEAVTTTNATFERLGALRNTSGYFGHRGWALGWGLGCALGVKLAWPDRPVLALLGDGAAMYGIVGLWSAAHHKIPVTFVVPNNAQYQILKAGARGLGLPAAKEGKFVGMDLRQPEIDFVALARSLGVRAERISEPDELQAAARESLAGDEPRLIEVPIQRSLAGPGQEA